MDAKEQYIAFRTIFRRELTRLLRIWTQTVLPPVITSTLFFAVFGMLVGTKLQGVMGHSSYIEFITPGLILLSVMTSAYENCVASFFIAKFQRSIEELIVSPTPNYIIITAYVAAGVIRALLIGFIVFCVANIFEPIHIGNIPLCLGTAILVATIFALAGLNNAFFAKNFDDVTWVPTFVITPLTYLGGVFYSINIIPNFWQNLIYLNPIYHMVELFRSSFTQITPVNTTVVIAILLMISASLFILALALLKKGTGMRQ